MQMYKTFVGINCHCFNHISQGDYYLNLEKDALTLIKKTKASVQIKI